MGTNSGNEELLEDVRIRLAFWIDRRLELTDCPPSLSEMAMRCQGLFGGDIEEAHRFIEGAIEGGRLPFSMVVRVEPAPQWPLWPVAGGRPS